MIGAVGEAITSLSPNGQVKVDGEIWQAHAPTEIRAGDPVRITGVNGLTLEVETTRVSVVNYAGTRGRGTGNASRRGWPTHSTRCRRTSRS